MPSYIADNYQSSGTTIDFDSHEFRLSMPGSKLDLSPRRLPDKPSHAHNQSYDDSSTTSTHTSDLSDTRSQPNGDATRPTSMSSFANGNPQRDASLSYPDEPNSKPHNGPTHNSFEVQHPALTAPSRPPPSAPTREPPRTPPQVNGHMSALNGNGNVDASAHGFNVTNGAPPSLETIPSNEVLSALGTPSPALSPAALTSNMDNERSRNNPSPHRLSSPPVYQQPNGVATTSASALHPPTHSGLKHRHTLEVPKTTPGRASRDGQDAYASGRFSPTVAPGRRGSLSLGRRNTRSLHSEVPRDEVVPDEDAMRWAEAYRQKRASKKKKREEEDDDHVLVGTKVDENHVNWVTAYNMLTGIRVSVSRTNAKIDRALTDADFEAKQKSTFDIAGNELVPSAKYDFKFKDYAPWVFRSLRNKFRLDPADYLMSLTGKYILSELGSPGKSGSFFYFSRDYKYIIKTIHHAEHKFLRKILKEYYRHVTENPNTLLSQFYGLHRVKLPFGKKIHFVVMNNLFPPHRDIHMTFDLKGSTIGRDYSEEDLEKNPRATLKDLNWMRRKKTLELGLQKKRLFLEQLQRDVRLLQRLEIMDYSLLTGIHDLQRGNQENLRDQTLKIFSPGGTEEQDPLSDPTTNVLMRTPSKLENARKARELRQMIQAEKPVPVDRMPDTLDEAQNRSVFYSDDGGFGATHENNTPANEVYYLGVIDCLTHYGMIKKIEHFWKGLSSDKTKISALPPQEYGERFFQFIEGVTMSQEEAVRKRIEEEEAAAAVAAEGHRERVSSWSSSGGRRSSTAAPPVPSYNPPPPPPANQLIARAEAESSRTSEGEVPNKILTTHHDPQNQAVLPVVEEAAESSASGLSRTDSLARPVTPPNDMPERAPPTPPKPGPLGVGLKNVDSGYSYSAKPRLSSSSLDKDLPPLPPVGV